MARPGQGWSRARGFSPAGGSCGGQSGGPPQRGFGAVGTLPSGPDGGADLGPGLGPHLSGAGADSSPSAQRPGGGQEVGQEGVPTALPCPILSSSPCATGQPVNAGGSGREGGAQSLLSVRQIVHGSRREPGRGCWLPEGQQRVRGHRGREGGQPSRGGTWKPSTVSGLATLPNPPQPGWALPVAAGVQDTCKLQVAGKGTPKLEGILAHPEAWRWRARRVLARLAAAAGGLVAQTDIWGPPAGGCPAPSHPSSAPHHPHASPSESQPAILELPALGSAGAGPGHSLCSR